jgi:hypothetical protein
VLTCASGNLLQEFFGALRHCRNSSPAECEGTIDVLANEGLRMIGWYHDDWFAQVPCWWTDGGAARKLAGRPLLFERPARWPAFVQADALSPSMRGCLEAIEGRLAAASDRKRELSIWKHNVTGGFVHPGEYLERALMPAMSAMKDDAWQEYGWSILSWYRDWSPQRNFEDVSSLPLIWDGELKDADVVRRKLSRCLRLPSDKGWRPAEQCYADRTWGAPRSFRSYFRKIADRAVVRPLAAWKAPLGPAEDADLWKGLLRFAGVSWEPKLVPTNRLPYADSYKTEQLSHFNRHEFDLQIEHFPECVTTERGLLPLVAAGRRVQAVAHRVPTARRERSGVPFCGSHPGSA